MIKSKSSVILLLNSFIYLMLTSASFDQDALAQIMH